jgi:hypothetical protein
VVRICIVVGPTLLPTRLHRLNIGLPSEEIISFLDDLLKMTYLISKNEIKDNEFTELFLNSFTFKVPKSLVYKKINNNCIMLEAFCRRVLLEAFFILFYHS